MLKSKRQAAELVHKCGCSTFRGCSSHKQSLLERLLKADSACRADAECTGLVRHTSRLLVAAARMEVPLVGVVLRRGYGLGAQAMLGGSTHEPLMTLAWPGAHLGAMGLEGAVRLSMRRELEAIEDEEQREARVRELTAYAQASSTALEVARVFEIDDVIDPAETRGVLSRLLDAADRDGRLTGSGRPVDTW